MERFLDVKIQWAPGSAEEGPDKLQWFLQMWGNGN